MKICRDNVIDENKVIPENRRKIGLRVDRPTKLTTSGRGKLTTLFAGEELRLSISIAWQESISASFLVVKYFCLGWSNETGLA